MPTEKVRAAFLPVGDAQFELLEPTDRTRSSRASWRSARACTTCASLVEDIDEALAELKGRGVRLLDETPRVGAGGCRVAFVHPKAAGGVLLELKQA